MREAMNWLQEVLTTAFPAGILVIGVAYLCRNLLVRIATKSIDARFDAKLETLRSELRKQEQSFAAEIKANELQLTSLRQGALSGLANRQSLLDKRRLEAADKLWASVVAHRQFAGFVQTMSMINFAKAADLTEKKPEEGEKFKKVFEAWPLADFKKLPDVTTERPYLTPLAWALFDAYRSIFAVAIAQAHIIGFGVGKELIDEKPFMQTMTAALPKHKDYIEKHGAAAGFHLMPEIQDKLLEEIANMLAGRESDKDSVVQAHEIVMYAEAVRNNVETPDVPEQFLRKD